MASFASPTLTISTFPPRETGPGRAKLSCANWAHAFAAVPGEDKTSLRNPMAPNIAIVSAYNDMLSAHQPFEHFPTILKAAAREVRSRSARVMM